MKIIHVEDYFLPQVGYQINIIPKYQKLQGHEVFIITSRVEGIKKNAAEFFGVEDLDKKDEIYEKETGVKIIRLSPLTKKLISSRIIQSNLFFEKILDLNPDVIYCHGNDTLTGIRLAIKYSKWKIPMVFDSHMLSMASINPLNKLFYKIYKFFISPIFIKHSIPIIRTQDDKFVENNLGIPITQCPWISYGSDILLFHPDKEVKSKFRKENGLNADDFVVVYTGKLDEAKNGKLLAETFKKKFNTNKNIVLLVVGNTVGNYGQEVKETLLNSENKIIHFPTQNYMDLAKFYQAADLSVFPKQCSLSFYDAQACGLPVVSEDNNINISRLQYNNGFFFKEGNVDDFREKINKCANMGEKEFDNLSKNAYNYILQNYNYVDKANQYTTIITNEYKRFHKVKEVNNGKTD